MGQIIKQKFLKSLLIEKTKEMTKKEKKARLIHSQNAPISDDLKKWFKKIYVDTNT